MIPEAVVLNKGVWINNLLRRGEGEMNATNLRSLLDSLSYKEIRILHKNLDLVEHVRRISAMSKEELVRAVRDDYGLEVTDCMNGDVWIGTDDQEKFIPGWAKTRLPYAGWYLSYQEEGEQFSDWARNFLLQEVRVRLWSKYIQKKMEAHSKIVEIPAIVDSTPAVEDIEPYFGFYI